MRKAFRHTGVLMMLGVVALGLVGAAYTLWYEKLTLNAQITTGSLDADWSLHSWTEDEGFSDDSTPPGNTGYGQPVVAIVPPGYGGLDWGVAGLLGLGGISTPESYALFNNANFTFNGIDKPQTVCEGNIGSNNAPGQANDTGNNNVLNLFMGGLFPYAGCEFSIDISNQGTVPFHIGVTGVSIKQCPITATGPTDAGCVAITAAPWSRGFDPANSAQCLAFFQAEWPISNVPQQIEVGDVPVQIHPDANLRCNFKLVLDQNPGAENKKYFVSINYATYQWNETPDLTLLD